LQRIQPQDLPSQDVTLNVAHLSNNPTASNTSPVHRSAFKNAREVFEGLKDNWEEPFNRFLETSLKYYGEEEENAEKERHEVKEMLFDEMWCVFSTLEKRCDFLETGIVKMAKAIKDREQKKTAADVEGDKKAT